MDFTNEPHSKVDIAEETDLVCESLGDTFQMYYTG